MAEKKTKLIIVSHGLEIGGAEKALLGLLEDIDYTQTEVDLFLFRHSGELFKYIPKEVNVLPEMKPYNGFAVSMKSIIRDPSYWKLIFGRLLAKMKSSIYLQMNKVSSENDIELVYSHYYCLPYLPMISEEKYDIAISFLTPHFFAVEKIKADRKAAWIHTDYSTLEVNQLFEEKMWKPYDWIISISKDCSAEFIKKFPKLEGKIILYENKLPKKTILKEASEIIEPYLSFVSKKEREDCLVFLSIGRYSHQKNFDSIPQIAAELVRNGLIFKWFIIGYGPEEPKIRDRIHEFQVENEVILLGKKQNPYPYIYDCDWYIQPSRYEGKSIAVQEAQLLNKPVIITDYPTSGSQVQNGVDGYIVPLDSIQCAEEIFKIVNSKGSKNRLSQNRQSN